MASLSARVAHSLRRIFRPMNVRGVRGLKSLFDVLRPKWTCTSALVCRMDRDSATSSCGSWPKLLAVAATIRRAWRLLTPVSVKGSDGDQGDRTDFVPRDSSIALVVKRPGVGQEEGECWQRWLDLMTQTMTTPSSTISSPFGVCDSYVRESCLRQNRFFQLCPDQHRTPPSPLLPLGKKAIPCSSWILMVIQE
ncbi:hypothetical protein GWK47_034770 [Chionoecetes opilio]|uniref:Uncharacterized protein n=1 Tax=Chionoecetes opilio TaxID=41210 RepID=A0A8J5D3H1_CHIOP|nr:hypothetical protein GWK47_034770 [Chionoecetes opilio]